MRVRAQVLISGLVQGVSFRAETQAKANSLELVGWVRNLADGRVEIVAEGEREKLEKLIAWSKLGPAPAQVSGVEVFWQEATGEFAKFGLRH